MMGPLNGNLRGNFIKGKMYRRENVYMFLYSEKRKIIPGIYLELSLISSSVGIHNLQRKGML